MLLSSCLSSIHWHIRLLCLSRPDWSSSYRPCPLIRLSTSSSVFYSPRLLGSALVTDAGPLMLVLSVCICCYKIQATVCLCRCQDRSSIRPLTGMLCCLLCRTHAPCRRLSPWCSTSSMSAADASCVCLRALQRSTRLDPTQVGVWACRQGCLLLAFNRACTRG